MEILPFVNQVKKINRITFPNKLMTFVFRTFELKIHLFFVLGICAMDPSMESFVSFVYPSHQ